MSLTEIKISEQAVLVEVSMTKWQNRITDRVTAGEISEQKKSRAGSTRVSHDLTDNSGVVGLATLYGHINNNIIKKFTLPWSKGLHMLPAALIEDFEREMNAAIAEWNDLVKQIEQTYDESVERAKEPAPVGLGKLFNKHWFPSVESVVSKYSIEVKPYTLLSDPKHVDDIRVNLPQAKVDKMKADLEKELAEVSKKTNIEVHKRITSTLKSFIDGMKRHGVKDGDGKSGAFRDNTVTKMAELADVSKHLNVTGDSKLDAAVESIKSDLADLQPSELREDKKKRSDVTKKAEKIVSDLDGLF